MARSRRRAVRCYHTVMNREKICAAIFDIDGTLTVLGQQEIPQQLFQKIVQLSEKIPLALATARVSASAIKYLEKFIAASPHPGKSRKNWFVICENGSLGLEWNEKKKEYEPWYSVQWPQEIPKEKLFQEMDSAVKNLTKNNTANVSSFSFRPKRALDESGESLKKKTAEMMRRLKPIFQKYRAGEQLRLVDSGVAVHVVPKDGDKDRGVREFAKRIGENVAEIAVFGDQPGAGMNDELFLNGKLGTPYNVGAVSTIRDKNGKILRGPDATLYVLNQIFQ